MNRPTDELDTLLSCADEAMAEGDYEEAVVILRQAAAVAPLRRDIRNRLALALEGAPVRQKSSKPAAPTLAKPVQTPAYEQTYDDPEDDYFDYPLDNEPPTQPAEPIADVARKAFKAAAGTTARATEATRNLTNLLHNGIQSWKSSLAGQVQPLKSARAEAEPEPTEAELFTAADAIDAYLGSQPAASVSTYVPAAPIVESEHDLTEESEPSSKAVPVARKKSAGPTKKSRTRPTDVEDVIAAGIGSLIEVAVRTEKKKFLFAAVYLAMACLFAVACFDAARKFPGVQAVPGSGTITTANLGGLDLTSTSDSPVSQARHLASIGKAEDAIALLKNKLVSGSPKASVDPIRVELAAQLNGAAEQKLRNNQLKESANLYREAVGVMPGDSGLTLRLANSLYYVGIMGNASAVDKKSALSESRAILNDLVAKGSDNVQVYRLLALVHEAEGEKNQATASWQKVKAMAVANSPEHHEAESRLK